MKQRDVQRGLERVGCVMIRSRGHESTWRTPGGRKFFVPIGHSERELERSFLKQLGSMLVAEGLYAAGITPEPKRPAAGPTVAALDASTLVLALRQLRCVESKRQDGVAIYRTPRGKYLPAVYVGSNREVRIGELNRLKKMLDREELDLWAAVERAIKEKARARTGCAHSEADRSRAGDRWVCGRCGEDVAGPAPVPLKAAIADRIEAGGRDAKGLEARAGARPAPAGPAPAAGRPTVRTDAGRVAAAPAGGRVEPQPAARVANAASDGQPSPSARGPGEEKTPMKKQRSPTDKLAVVRQVRRAIDPTLGKSAAESRAAGEAGVGYTDYMSLVRLLRAAGYTDLDHLPDEAARAFDVNRAVVSKRIARAGKLARARLIAANP